MASTFFIKQREKKEYLCRKLINVFLPDLEVSGAMKHADCRPVTLKPDELHAPFDHRRGMKRISTLLCTSLFLMLRNQHWTSTGGMLRTGVAGGWGTELRPSPCATPYQHPLPFET